MKGDKMYQPDTGHILMGVGLAIGIVVTILLVTSHPILIGLEVLGAAIFFIGKYIAKE